MMNELDRISYLVDEIRILKTQLREVDTGHIHTTIAVLEDRVKEVRKNLYVATAAFRNEGEIK